MLGICKPHVHATVERAIDGVGELVSGLECLVDSRTAGLED